MTRAWLTTVVTSTKSERPKTTPSTERHHTYDSPRRICGYAAPSGGRAPPSAPVAGVGACEGRRRAAAPGVADRAAGWGPPARTAGLPDLLRALGTVRAGTDGLFSLVTVSRRPASTLSRSRVSGRIRRIPAPRVRSRQQRSAPEWTAGPATRSTRTTAVKHGSR